MTHQHIEVLILKKEVIKEVEAYFGTPLQHVYGDYIYALQLEGIGGCVWLTFYQTFVDVSIGVNKSAIVSSVTCSLPDIQGLLLETIKACLRQVHVQYAINLTNIQKILSKD